MGKKRHEVLLDIIRNNEIENQFDLVNKLNENGFNVTQATVSRDIDKLKIVKVKVNNNFKYVVVDNVEKYSENDLQLLHDSILQINVTNNLIVLKTVAKMGEKVASVIRKLQLSEILGTFSDKDAVLLVCESNELAQVLFNKFEILLKKEF